MVRAKSFPPISAIALLVAGTLACAAQTAVDLSSPVQFVRVVPQPVPYRPFPVGATPAATGLRTLELLPPEQMTEADRQLEAASERDLAARAAAVGIQYGHDGWSYRQIACAALPGHLLLRFARDNGPGDLSLFSASIPRSGQGKIRVVPLRRRGYSLFSPAPVNAQTVSSFNHIRAEEGSTVQADWLELGLCYAALAGASPWVLEPAPTERAGILPVPGMATLMVEQGRGAAVLFTDRAATPAPMDWALTFDERGTLLKASRRPAATLSSRMLLPGAPPTAERTVPATITDLRQSPPSRQVPAQ